jgi:hypothetical protein
MPDFTREDLTGARFDQIDLTGARFRNVDLTDDYLAGTTDPVTRPGYPEPKSFPVRRYLGAIVNEEWEHRLFAERDLDALESRGTG